MLLTLAVVLPTPHDYSGTFQGGYSARFIASRRVLREQEGFCTLQNSLERTLEHGLSVDMKKQTPLSHHWSVITEDHDLRMCMCCVVAWVLNLVCAHIVALRIPPYGDPGRSNGN